MKRSPIGCAPKAATFLAILAVPAYLLIHAAVTGGQEQPQAASGAAKSKENRQPPATKVKSAPTKKAVGELKPIELSKELKKLGDNLYIDDKQKWVVMDGEVVLRRGPPLEMFACLKNTKEHESIVSVGVKALHVHGALLAVGAKQGTPVQFDPVYKPATGTEIEIRLLWTDEKGKPRQARAQDWIRDIGTKKAMTHPFVFAGSMFWTDEETGQRHYTADGGGELICVANFSSAVLDLPVASSQSAAGLLFEALTENVPTEGTKVRLVLMPKREAVKPATKDKNPARPAAK